MSEKRRIWDFPVRLVHVLLIGLVGLSWYTGETMHVFSFGPQTGPSQFDLHRWSGYTLLTLVLFRVAWGLLGSTTARFSHFLKGPRSVLAYVRSLMRGGSADMIGHNPIGGWSVILMLALLLSQAVIGLMASEDTYGLEGPLDHLVGKENSLWLGGIHHLLFEGILVITGIHILAVFGYLVFKRDNLITPMLTGRSTKDVGEPLTFRPVWRAAVILALSAALVWAAVSYL